MPTFEIEIMPKKDQLISDYWCEVEDHSSPAKQYKSNVWGDLAVLKFMLYNTGNPVMFRCEIDNFPPPDGRYQYSVNYFKDNCLIATYTLNGKHN